MSSNRKSSEKSATIRVPASAIVLETLPVEITCPHCKKTFPATEHVNFTLCSYCLREFKTPRVFPSKHFVQYHKTDDDGPPARTRDFGIETKKSVDNLHGNTVWLISGEGSPKKYHLECRFVVDQTGPIEKPDDVTYYAKGKNGMRPPHPILLNEFPWFQKLKGSLGVFGFGLSEIGQSTVSELEKLLQKGAEKPKVKKKVKKV